MHAAIIAVRTARCQRGRPAARGARKKAAPTLVEPARSAAAPATLASRSVMNRKLPPASVSPAQAGFTLVEIMVVIVILGLLATLVVPNVIGMGDEAKVTKAQSDVKMIAGAVTLYRTKKGKLPESLDVLIETDDKGGGALLTELSKDPWDHDYELREDGPNKWEVISLGPDGVASEDDISSKAKKEDGR
jgi:general secretion pathway protein G